MKLLFSDGRLWKEGGRLHLLQMNHGWRIVGPGYLCAVETREEGDQVMGQLKAEGEALGVIIEY